MQHPPDRLLPAGQWLVACASLLAATLCWSADGKIQPGQWRTTDTVLEMENPALSADVIARRKAKPAVVDYCVRSDDLVALVVGKDAAGVCEGAISTSGGRITGTRKCGGGKAVRSIDGSYSATRIETVRDVRLETPNGTAHTKSRVVSERLGDCP